MKTKSKVKLPEQKLHLQPAGADLHELAQRIGVSMRNGFRIKSIHGGDGWIIWMEKMP